MAIQSPVPVFATEDKTCVIVYPSPRIWDIERLGRIYFSFDGGRRFVRLRALLWSCVASDTSHTICVEDLHVMHGDGPTWRMQCTGDELFFVDSRGERIESSGPEGALYNRQDPGSYDIINAQADVPSAIVFAD